MLVVLLVGGSTYEAYGAAFQIWLEHVGGIHGTIVNSTGTNKGVNFVYVDNIALSLLLYAVHDLLDAVLHIAAVLCARQQGTDVQLVYSAPFQSRRHLSLLYPPGQSPYEGRLAHARFADVQRIVFLATA